MKNKISRRSFLAAAAVSAAALAVSGCDAKKSKKEVTDITVWNYYNGDQLESFNRLVSTFNETIGKAKGIRVTGSSQGTVNDLEANVMDAAEGKVGSAEMPTIFAAYADTAYKLDQMGMVVDLKDYLTEDEQAAFVPGYITEGDFDGSGSIKIFPVAKSTELMFFNDTDWQRFSKETFVRYGALSTMEGVTAVAEQYYNWSGGRALFGRNAMANYMIVGAKQLGCEIFEVRNGKMTLHFDHDVVRKLWDNYYVPFIKGYFAANGRFRSDDVKTGALLGCVGSCASATFFPKQVMPGDNQVHDIEMKVLPAPRFAGSEKVAVLCPALFQAGHLCQWVVLPLLALGAGVGRGGHLAGAVRADRKFQLVQCHPRQLAVCIQQHGSRHGADIARTVCTCRFGQNPQSGAPRRALRRTAARRGAAAHRAGAAAGASPAAAGQCQCCRQCAAQKPSRCLFHIVTYAPFPCLHCRRRLWSQYAPPRGIL